jgi:hypothetical protein
MKKVSFIAIVGAAGLMSSAAFAGGAVSIAQGVNFGSQTQIGVNNIQGQIQGVNAEHVDSINNLRSLDTFQSRGADVEIGRQAFVIGSIVDSGNGGRGGSALALVNQDVIAKVETDMDRGRFEAEKGGELGNARVAALGKAEAEGVRAGAGGAGSASTSSVDSNNISIANVSTSTADYHSVRFTKVDVDVDVDVEANVALNGSVASKGGIVNGEDGVVVNDSLNSNKLALPF